jgi:hypothetical protein
VVTHHHRRIPAVLALLLAGCATVYERPTDEDSQAIIKFRRVYDPADGQTVGPSLRERLMIDDHVAYEAKSYAVLVQTPRIDEVRVRAALATFTASVALSHLAWRGQGARAVLDDVCSRSVRFLPASGASYVLELTFQDNACSLACFEQVPRPSGELENRPCPVVPPPPPPRAPPVTNVEVH